MVKTIAFLLLIIPTPASFRGSGLPSSIKQQYLSNIKEFELSGINDDTYYAYLEINFEQYRKRFLEYNLQKNVPYAKCKNCFPDEHVCQIQIDQFNKYIDEINFHKEIRKDKKEYLEQLVAELESNRNIWIDIRELISRHRSPTYSFDDRVDLLNIIDRIGLENFYNGNLPYFKPSTVFNKY